MIFGRRKRDRDEVVEEVAEAVTAEEPTEVEPVELGEAESALAKAEAQAAAWDQSFSREEGPFDVHEVDLDADADEVTRIDFGSLVLTPFEGMSLQLQMNRETEQVQALLVGDGESALEVCAFAGPMNTSFAPEVRSDIINSTAQQKGRIQLAEGPFGAELRRMVPVTNEEGAQGMHVSRTWLVSGPGWLLRGVVLGKATVEVANEDAQVKLTEFFSNLVIRRDGVPRAPGTQLPLVIPKQAAEG